MKGLSAVAVVSAATLLMLAGCSKPDRWLGVVYADQNDLTNPWVIGEFASVTDCVNAAKQEIDSYGGYECRLNCASNTPPWSCESVTDNFL